MAPTCDCGPGFEPALNGRCELVAGGDLPQPAMVGAQDGAPQATSPPIGMNGTPRRVVAAAIHIVDPMDLAVAHDPVIDPSDDAITERVVSRRVGEPLRQPPGVVAILDAIRLARGVEERRQRLQVFGQAKAPEAQPRDPRRFRHQDRLGSHRHGFSSVIGPAPSSVHSNGRR